VRTGYFEKNIEALIEKEPELVSRLKSVKDDPRVSVDGDAMVMTLEGGRTVRFERQELPANVSRISDKNLFGFSEVIILAGVGVGETLVETLKTADATAFVLLIESNIAYFKKLLEGFDLSRELGDPRVCVSVGENPVDAVMVRLEKEFGVFTRSNFQLIKNGLSVSCDTDYYHQLDEVLSRQKSMADANLQAITTLSGLWQTNILANLSYILGSPGISHLFGKLKGIPALIVSAGPSLDKNCRWIKVAKSSMVVICVDTALKTLLRNGITPHFVVSLDALIENWSHLDGVDSSGYTLVVNPVTYPKILSEHKGDMMVTSYSEPLVQWLERFTGDLGINTTGGSVATSAFDFANRMGCSPIILTGQDLAFSGGRTHAGGAKQESVYQSFGSNAPQGSLHSDAIDFEAKYELEGNLGHRLLSSVKMNTWRNWFEIQIEKEKVHCINATEGGARIKGAEIYTMQEVSKIYCGTKRDIESVIKKNIPVKLPASTSEVGKELMKLVESAREIKKLCSHGLKVAGEIAALAQKKGEEKNLDERVRLCGAYMQKIMKETDFLEINHWRLENTLDKIQRIRSAFKSSESRKKGFISGEVFLIFFREMYQVTKDMENKVKKWERKTNTSESRRLVSVF